MSTLQLASDTTGRILVVEWNKYPPHFRVITDDGRVRAYHSEAKAMTAAKRLARKLKLTLKQDYDPRPYKRMATEFPEFDQDTLPPIPADWTDSSWHNDTCPTFVIEDLGLQIFIDFDKVEDREIPGTDCRFVVVGIDGVTVDDLLQTDYWTQVIDLVNRRRAIKEDQA